MSNMLHAMFLVAKKTQREHQGLAIQENKIRIKKLLKMSVEVRQPVSVHFLGEKQTSKTKRKKGRKEIEKGMTRGSINRWRNRGTDHPSSTNASATKKSEVAFASRMEWQRRSVAGCHCPTSCCRCSCGCCCWRGRDHRAGGVAVAALSAEVNLMTMESPMSFAR